MVYVNSKKFACESCIKGHRSSNCHHADRPLFEIKKKGRPVSQCEKCREARSTRRIHARCTCSSSNAEPSTKPIGSRDGKRFIPTVPTLPNGLRDAFQDTAPSSHATESKINVDLLLNPCRCNDVWSCKCSSQGSSNNSNLKRIRSTSPGAGLAALAQAAASCAPASTHSSPLEMTTDRGTSVDCPRDATSHDLASTDLSTIRHMHIHPPKDLGIRSIQLTSPEAELGRSVHPAFPTTSDATYEAHTDDKCYCGHQCACPDCTLHRGIGFSKDAASHKGHQGPCRDCIDHEGGVELPGHKPESTFLDQFFARAASLPTPPSGRRARHGSLDPTNVTVLPFNLMARSKSAMEPGVERAFGLITIPKLECCGGRCSCPDSKCGCGEECGGCCVDDANKNIHDYSMASDSSATSLSDIRLFTTSQTQEVASGTSASEIQGSCCS